MNMKPPSASQLLGSSVETCPGTLGHDLWRKMAPEWSGRGSVVLGVVLLVAA